MATPNYYQPAPLPYQPIVPPNASNPIGYQSQTDPRKLAENQRQRVAGQGDAFIANDQSLGNQFLNQSSGTQQYLNPIESTLASGNGGYSPTETSAIELSPEDKQNIITGAGISAGVGNAAAVGAAERAAAAGGGNPAALATFRARAAQSSAGAAGDAMTQARIAAKTAEAGGATNVGGARLNQQNQGLQYYNGLQGQQTQSGLAEEGLAQGAYGTETGGTGQAAGLGLQASQTPTTFDKTIGAVAAAAPALAKLEDGSAGAQDAEAHAANSTFRYLSNDGMDAVLGEAGPEVIVDGTTGAQQSHMADGYPGSGEAEGPEGSAMPPMSPTTSGDASHSWLQTGGDILRRYLDNSEHQAVAPAGAARTWSPVDTYTNLGKAVGTGATAIASHFADGGFPPDGPSVPKPPTLINKPTHVKLDPGDQVVPLSFRPKAKIRPSVALHAMRQRPMFGGGARV